MINTLSFSPCMYVFPTDTEAIYDRDPPLWVYPRVAMSLVQLQAGVQGYEHMMNLTKHRAYQRIQQHQPYYYPQANPHVATQSMLLSFFNLMFSFYSGQMCPLIVYYPFFIFIILLRTCTASMECKSLLSSSWMC